MERAAVRRAVCFSLALAAALCALILLRWAQVSYLRSVRATAGGAAVFPVGVIEDRARRAPLAGTWEYYPDVLLYSEPENAAGAVPVYVTVPTDPLSPDFPAAFRSGKGSLRAVLTDVPDLGENNTILYLCSLMADYEVYVNGQWKHQILLPPNAHQIYAVNGSGTVEIVIEFTGGRQGLNTIPYVSYVRPSMQRSDNIRLASIILILIFLLFFVMFLVFFSSARDREMRPVFFYGLVLALVYALNMLWALGLDASIQRFLPFSALRALILTAELAVILLAFWVFYREYGFQRFKKRFLLESALTAGAWLALTLNSVLRPSWPLRLLGVLLLAGAAAVWIGTVYGLMLREREQCLRLSLVLLLVLFTVTVNLLVWDLNLWGNGLFYVLPAAIAVYVVFCFSKYRMFKQAQMERLETLLAAEKLVTRTQAALLVSQIKSHFLCNTLLSIQNLCKKDPDLASALIVRFSNYLRYNIDFMNYAELIPFEEELAHIENFIYIQKARFQDMLTFRSEILFTGFEIPPLTIQPIVENAITHGLRKSDRGGAVTLRVWREAARVHIRITNDAGPPFDPAAAKLRSLYNIQERLKSLKNAAVDIRGLEPEGTAVDIEFPL